MTGSMERKRIRPLILAITMVGALFASLLPMGAAQAQTAPAARDTELACPEGADYPDFDDIEGNTFEELIRCLAAYEITQGIDADSYGPSQGVRRDQMASFIARLIRATDDGGAGLDEASDGENQFADVPASNVHRDNIEDLADAGVVNGRTATQYDPEAIVRRDQMASFIARALRFVTGDELPADAGADFFADDEGNVHEDNINDLAGEGIVQGRVTTSGAKQGAGIYAPADNTRRDSMSAFIMRSADLLIEEGFMEPIDGGQRSTVTVTTTNVQPGGNIQGAITGEGVQSATVSGPCVASGPVNDTSATTDGIQFTIPTNSNAANGSCTLTFTVTFADGTTETVTRTVTVGQAATGSRTSRPELTGATIVSTTTTGQANTTQNAGTVVRYTFDEAITAQPAVAGLFHVYRSDVQPAAAPGGAPAQSGFSGTGICGVGGVVCNLGTAGAKGTNQVDVLFGGINNTATAPLTNPANLTVATVDNGAVSDGSTTNATNPEGDAPIGAAGSVTLTAGATAAPDLQNISAVRGTTVPGTAAVDFTFDVAARVQRAGPGGPDTGNFHIISLTGERSDCTASTTNTTPSQNTPGGTGGTTITVTCPAFTPAAGLPFEATMANIARGVVDAGAVSSGAPDAPCPVGPGQGGPVPAGAGVAYCNPQQATQTPDQSTNRPDLVTVTLRPATSAGANDEVIYAFDEPILATNSGAAVTGTNFYVYQSAGNEVVAIAGAAGPPDTRPQVSGSQVVVFYPNGTLTTAVGGGVRENAVTASNNNLQNRQDEVGVSNPNTFQQTPGRTNGPDLTGVNLVQGVSGFSTTFTAIYTFDAQVGTGSGFVQNANLNSTRFFLYLSDGSQLICQGAVTNATPAASGLQPTQVACANYAFGPAGQVGTNTPAAPVPAATIGQAVLGTVNDGAVFASNGGLPNPEGAEPTQGGTGTPAS